jgi:hypothetical protein
MTELNQRPLSPPRLPINRAAHPPVAHTAKIVTAGLSASMVLGIVSFLGYSSKVEADRKAELKRNQQDLAAADSAANADDTSLVDEVTDPESSAGLPPGADPQVIVLDVPEAPPVAESVAPAAPVPAAPVPAAPSPAAPAPAPVVKQALPKKAAPKKATPKKKQKKAPAPAAPTSGTTSQSG